MKHFYSTLALCASLGVASLLPSDAFAQSGRGRDQVCVYEHAGYGGWEQCYGIGESIRDLGGRRNQISAIRIQGRAEITLYEHPNFQGREVTLSEGASDLRQVSRFWNDEVDSLRVVAAGFPERRGRDERSADRVCVYQHAGFQGHSQCFNAGDEVPDLQELGWNDGISSIRTFGHIRVAFYEHGGFQGQRLVVDGDVANLAQVRTDDRSDWNDRISSLRVEGLRRDRRPH